MAGKPRAARKSGAGRYRAAQSESTEQTIFVNRVRQLYSDVVIFAIPNGGGRSKKEGAKLKAEGVLAGVPDLMVPKANVVYNGLFIEMKKVGSRGMSKHQKLISAKLVAEGYLVATCFGHEEAWNTFEEYMKL